MSQDPTLNSRLSVRRVLPGMTAVSKSTATGITPSAGVRKMLRNASANKGSVKIQIKNQVMVGKSVGSKNLVDREWSEKFDGLRKYLDENEPCYIACWRGAKDCLLVSFIPETTAPRSKMLYAGTTEALKVSIGEIDEKGSIEEYNIREAEELSFEAYEARKNTPLAYSEFELEKMEIEQQEKKEMEERTQQMKARGKNAPPVALLGLSVAAAVVAQGKAGGGRLNVKEAVKAANLSKAKPAKKTPKVVEKMAAQQEEDDDEKQTEEELEEEVKKEVSELQELAKDEEEGGEDAEKEKEAEEAKKKEEEEAAAAKKKEEEEAAAAKKKEEEEEAAAKKKKAEEKKEKTTVVAPIGGTVAKQKDKIKNSFKFFKDKVQKGAASVKPAKKKGMSAAELEKYPADDGKHTLSELQEMVKTKEFGDVDKNTIETYLSSREFVQAFSVDKEEFKTLPGWKQRRLKTENKLF